MFTKILASIGIGIGIVIVLNVIVTIMSHMQTHKNDVRLFTFSEFLATATIIAHFVIGGAPVIKTIGLVTLLFVPLDFIIGPLFTLILKDLHYSDDEKVCQMISCDIGILINTIITSVFAVLIINHFGII